MELIVKKELPAADFEHAFKLSSAAIELAQRVRHNPRHLVDAGGNLEASRGSRGGSDKKWTDVEVGEMNRGEGV